MTSVRAPFSRSFRTTSVYPSRTAVIRGVSPSSSVVSTSAPVPIRNRAISETWGFDRAQGPVKGGATALVTAVNFGPALDQGGNGVRVAAHGREMEREIPPGHDFGLGPGLEQNRDDLRLPSDGGPMESGPDLAFNADIRPGGDQGLDEFHRALFDGHDQRSHVEGITDVDIGSPFDQQAAGLDSALSHGENQRGHAAAVLGVDRGSFVQQIPDEVEVSARRRPSGAASGRPCPWPRPGPDPCRRASGPLSKFPCFAASWISSAQRPGPSARTAARITQPSLMNLIIMVLQTRIVARGSG